MSNEVKDLAFIELMKAEGEKPEVIAKFTEVLSFAREHGLRCSGHPRKITCDTTPVTVILLHGRLFAVQCFDCVSITTHVIMYMGHGSCRHEGFRNIPLEHLRKWSEILAKRPVVVDKGRMWNFKKQFTGEKELDKFLLKA